MNMHRKMAPDGGTCALKVLCTAGLQSARGEILILEAERDLQLGDYALFISKFSKARGAGLKAMKCFLLPRTQVFQGDQVTIHTRRGRYHLDETSGLRVHNIYLGESRPLYRSSRRALKVMRVNMELVLAPLGRDALAPVDPAAPPMTQ